MERYKNYTWCSKCGDNEWVDKWWKRYHVLGEAYLEEVIERECKNCGYKMPTLPLDHKEDE